MVSKQNLLPVSKDPRDFNHKKAVSKGLFGSIKDETVILPIQGLGRKPLAIKDQKTSNYCTGFNVSSSSEYQEKIILSPEYQTAKIGQVAGKPIYNGADPRDAMKSATKFGSLPFDKSPLNFVKDGWEKPADWNNYKTELDSLASIHKKKSYFSVTWGFPDDLDAFESARLALWVSNKDNGVIMVFGFWYNEFNQVGQNGVVITPASEPITRHAYIVYDWCEINGKTYLKAQLSQGTGYGDGGTLYMSREAFNKSMRRGRADGVGMYIFVDHIDVETLKSTGDASLNLLDYVKMLLKKCKNYILSPKTV